MPKRLGNELFKQQSLKVANKVLGIVISHLWKNMCQISLRQTNLYKFAVGLKVLRIAQQMIIYGNSKTPYFIKYV